MQIDNFNRQFEYNIGYRSCQIEIFGVFNRKFRVFGEKRKTVYKRISICDLKKTLLYLLYYVNILGRIRRLIMLSLECQTVYDLIRQIAGEEEVYKIIEADEILERIPKAIPLSKIQLSAIIRELKDREYILVKYFTPDEYCLSVVKRLEEAPKPAAQAPAVEEEKPQERTLYQNKQIKAKSEKTVGKGVLFLMSLLGSLVGSAIVAVVTVLLIKFL